MTFFSADNPLSRALRLEGADPHRAQGPFREHSRFSLHAERLTPRSFEEVLSTLCRLTSQKTWEDRGQLLQQELAQVRQVSFHEPPKAYYDITQQLYYWSHCPYAQLVHAERGTAIVVGFGMVVSREHHHPILCRALPGVQNNFLSVALTLDLL